MVNKKPLPATHAPLADRLARNIATRRKSLRWTQSRLAEQLGVETETVSRFERGKHLPSLTLLEKLATVLQTTITDLLAEAPVSASDYALALTAWLDRLPERDRAFVLASIKSLAEHLADRNKQG